jgi:glycine reductase
LVVVLGTPTADSSKVYAMTVTGGDPSWAGPLAGVALGLPAFHITEPEIKAQVDEEVYGTEVGMAELVLEAEEIAEALGDVRRANAGA